MQNSAEQAVLNRIKERMQATKGHLGLYYKNLVSGFEYGVNESDTFLAASVIKLPLFLHVLKRDYEGTLSLGDRLITENDDKVPSCGALNMFTGAVEADILTLCRLMICISDNTATNRLIKHCTIEGVEQGFLSMGLEKTKIRRLLFDSEASRKGIQNTICPKELGALLEKLYNGTFINEAVSKTALGVLFEQQINHKLGGKLKEADIAHKTGEDDDLSNDVGIVYAPQPFVICFAGHNTDVYEWETIMREGCYDLYKAQQ